MVYIYIHIYIYGIYGIYIYIYICIYIYIYIYMVAHCFQKDLHLEGSFCSTFSQLTICTCLGSSERHQTRDGHHWPHLQKTCTNSYLVTQYSDFGDVDSALLLLRLPFTSIGAWWCRRSSEYIPPEPGFWMRKGEHNRRGLHTSRTPEHACHDGLLYMDFWNI